MDDLIVNVKKGTTTHLQCPWHFILPDKMPQLCPLLSSAMKRSFTGGKQSDEVTDAQ